MKKTTTHSSPKAARDEIDYLIEIGWIVVNIWIISEEIGRRQESVTFVITYEKEEA